MGLSELPTLPNRFAEIDGQRVRYTSSGEGKPIVLLPGWGARIESYGVVPSVLSQRFRVIALDLPGFGESPVPNRPWSAHDYADFVAAFLRDLDPGPVALVGHSHGGRVSISFAARYPDRLDKLVLVDSAGIVPPRGLAYHLRVRAVKTGRWLLSAPPLAPIRDRATSALYRAAGSGDYNAAMDPILRATLVRCVNEDLRGLLPTIPVPTLLVWGSNDRDTPLRDAKLIESLMPDAGLVVFEGAGHFSYLERPDQFCRIVGHFVEH